MGLSDEFPVWNSLNSLYLVSLRKKIVLMFILLSSEIYMDYECTQIYHNDEFLLIF